MFRSGHHSQARPGESWQSQSEFHQPPTHLKHPLSLSILTFKLFQSVYTLSPFDVRWWPRFLPHLLVAITVTGLLTFADVFSRQWRCEGSQNKLPQTLTHFPSRAIHTKSVASFSAPTKTEHHCVLACPQGPLKTLYWSPYRSVGVLAKWTNLHNPNLSRADTRGAGTLSGGQDHCPLWATSVCSQLALLLPLPLLLVHDYLAAFFVSFVKTACSWG